MSHYDNQLRIYDATLDELQYLKLEDLYQVFSIFCICCGLSIFLLLIEIYFQNCMKKLDLSHEARKLNNRFKLIAYKKKSSNSRYQKGALYYIIHRYQKNNTRISN